MEKGTFSPRTNIFLPSVFIWHWSKPSSAKFNCVFFFFFFKCSLSLLLYEQRGEGSQPLWFRVRSLQVPLWCVSLDLWLDLTNMFHAPPRWRDFCSGLPAAFRSSGENWSPLAVAEYTWYQFHTGQVSVGSHPSFYFFFFLMYFLHFGCTPQNMGS